MLGGPAVIPVYQFVLLLAGALALVVAHVAWRNRPNVGARYLALTALGAAVWTAPSLLQSLTPSLFLDELFSRLAYLGITITMPSWFLLAAEYTGHDRLTSRPVRTAVWAVAGGMLVMAWSGLVVDHQLLYADLSRNPGSLTGLAVEHGAGFYAWVVFGYLLTFATFYMFIQWFRRSTELYRRQATMTVLAATAPLVGNALYVSGALAVDATPFGFAFGAAALAFGVFEFRLTDVTPVARESLMANIRDGVLVLDSEGRITDANPAARRLLDLDGRVVGRPARAVLDGPVGEIAAAADDEETQRLVSLAGADGVRHVDVRVWPQSGGRGRSLGHLFYLRDVTERERRERELERQNERLDRFASLVSHDLRNPLSVSEGYTELARETGDISHLDDVTAAHERMEELVEDVLAMAREGAAVEEPEPTDVDGVARTAWETVDTGDATLDVRTDATVLADPVRLRRLFENLFRNAVEHGARDDGTLTVTVGRVADAPRPVDDGGPTDGDVHGGFFVADDGVGIPEDEREDVLTDGYTTADEGTGLGLSVVQSISSAHGWDVTVAESEAGGARFEFRGVTRPAAVAGTTNG